MMIERGDARRLAAEMLKQLRQRPEIDAKTVLDGLLFASLEERVGSEEAASVRQDATADWRDEVCSTRAREYALWLASGACAKVREVDTLVVRRCCDILSDSKLRGVDDSVLRAAVRNTREGADAGNPFRSKRDIVVWAESLRAAIEEHGSSETEPRAAILLEALSSGAFTDFGSVDVDLLRVMISELLRGDSRVLASRHLCREWAAQLLYQFGMMRADPDAHVMDAFWQQQLREELGPETADCILRWMPDWRDALAPERLREFTASLVRGVIENGSDIDLRITAAADNWDLDRIGRVELAIIRLAVFEMVIEKDVPAVVCIDEAVELSKILTLGESSGFVNGILDRMRREIEHNK